MRSLSRDRLVLRPALPPLTLTPPDDLPCFELTFRSGGQQFKALSRGRNAVAASHEALLELAHQCPDFDPETARLVAAVQTR